MQWQDWHSIVSNNNTSTYKWKTACHIACKEGKLMLFKLAVDLYRSTYTPIVITNCRGLHMFIPFITLKTKNVTRITLV